MPGGLIAPPPNMTEALPVPATTVNRDGNYTGTAAPMDTGGGLCLQTRKVGNFFVRGDRVRYGGFRGRIDSDSGLQMIYGSVWIVGQFDGATFHGQLDIPGRFGALGCTYLLNLQRTGP
jgi:hypothetical protein